MKRRFSKVKKWDLADHLLLACSTNIKTMHSGKAYYERAHFVPVYFLFSSVANPHWSQYVLPNWGRIKMETPLPNSSKIGTSRREEAHYSTGPNSMSHPFIQIFSLEIMVVLIWVQLTGSGPSYFLEIRSGTQPVKRPDDRMDIFSETQSVPLYFWGRSHTSSSPCPFPSFYL